MKSCSSNWNVMDLRAEIKGNTFKFGFQLTCFENRLAFQRFGHLHPRSPRMYFNSLLQQKNSLCSSIRAGRSRHTFRDIYHISLQLFQGL